MIAVRSALFLLWFLFVTTILSLVFLPVLVLRSLAAPAIEEEKD